MAGIADLQSAGGARMGVSPVKQRSLDRQLAVCLETPAA